jgi:hypothetical protein
MMVLATLASYAQTFPRDGQSTILNFGLDDPVFLPNTTTSRLTLSRSPFPALGGFVPAAGLAPPLFFGMRQTGAANNISWTIMWPTWSAVLRLGSRNSLSQVDGLRCVEREYSWRPPMRFGNPCTEYTNVGSCSSLFANPIGSQPGCEVHRRPSCLPARMPTPA